MKSYEELTEIINNEIECIFNEKIDVLDFSSKNLLEPIKYALLQGGKRMRPTLLLLACEINGGDIDDALYPAIGLELFHNMTLIHDDIMDNADIRRSYPTVYKKWDVNTAILAGDAIFALAIRYLVKTKSNFIKDITVLFNYTSLKVCEGQQFDMDFEKVDEVSIDEYIQMIRYKTAVMLASALKIGALIAGASLEQQNYYFSYGENIGLAFQLMDDWLDVYGNADVFGKNLGGDIIEGKKTYLYLKALEQADPKTKETLINIYNDFEIDNEQKIKEVMDIYEKLNINQLTLDAIKNYQKTAYDILPKLYLNKEGYDLLKEYSDKLFIRSY
ncbi:MAG: polyprenyl synthetase family protein [Bacteroidales bacterium]